MKSPKEARPTSTPKKATCKGPLKCGPTVSGRITPTSKCVPKYYNKPSAG